MRLKVAKKEESENMEYWNSLLAPFLCENEKDITTSVNLPLSSFFPWKAIILPPGSGGSNFYIRLGAVEGEENLFHYIQYLIHKLFAILY